jgi:ATP-binding cassette subfamily F protein 3
MEQRRADRITAEKHYREQQKEIARQEAYIAQQRQWNRERNIIAAESRQKLLDKMVKLEKPQNAPRPVRMKFTQALASGNDVLSVQALGMAFGERRLFQNVSFDLKKGQRVMLIGKNGCGKSTMIKLILDMLSPTEGIIEAGYNVQVGYYDQENQNLTDENTVLEELWSAYPHLPEVKIRNTLAMFRFIGEDVFKTVAVLSGGERARLTLAKLILSHMNLLVLDEPTNHLDIDSREALESALEEYDGTIFAVSHDRYFVEKLATRILELCPHPCFGSDLLDFSIGHVGQGYAEFITYRDARIAERTAAATATATVSAQTNEQSSSKEAYLRSKQSAADERKRKNRLDKLKKMCADMEAELDSIDEQLSGDAATDYVLVAKLDSRKTELEDQLLAAYEEIEQLEE